MPTNETFFYRVRNVVCLSSTTVCYPLPLGATLIHVGPLLRIDRDSDLDQVGQRCDLVGQCGGGRLKRGFGVTRVDQVRVVSLVLPAVARHYLKVHVLIYRRVASVSILSG